MVTTQAMVSHFSLASLSLFSSLVSCLRSNESSWKERRGGTRRPRRRPRSAGLSTRSHSLSPTTTSTLTSCLMTTLRRRSKWVWYISRNLKPIQHYSIGQLQGEDGGIVRFTFILFIYIKHLWWIVYVLFFSVLGAADISSRILEPIQSHRSAAAYWQCKGKYLCRKIHPDPVCVL